MLCFFLIEMQITVINTKNGQTREKRGIGKNGIGNGTPHSHSVQCQWPQSQCAQKTVCAHLTRRQ